MTDRQELFCREVAIGELVAEEHADDRGNRKGVEDPALLGRAEAEAGQVAEDQGKPGAPDKELQHHHQDQLESNGFVHRYEAGAIKN
jgi:hypothetical protein